MVWSQFSNKTLGAHFGNSLLHNLNWVKISQSLAKKIKIWNRVQLFEMKKKRIVNQILLSKLWYVGRIYNILKFIIKKLEKTTA